MLLEVATGVKITDLAFRKLFPGISFPSVLANSTVNTFGYVVLDDRVELRIVEIKNRFIEIDCETIRPLRALMVGTGTLMDTEKLNKLTEEHTLLLAELHALQQS